MKHLFIIFLLCFSLSGCRFLEYLSTVPGGKEPVPWYHQGGEKTRGEAIGDRMKGVSNAVPGVPGKVVYWAGVLLAYWSARKRYSREAS